MEMEPRHEIDMPQEIGAMRSMVGRTEVCIRMRVMRSNGLVHSDGGMSTVHEGHTAC